MWLLIEGGCFAMSSRSWDGLPPRLPSPRFSSAPARPAAPPSASRTCGGPWRCNATSSRLRPAVVLAIAASLLAGCATARSDGASCPPVVRYSREFLARAADELDSLPAGSAIDAIVHAALGLERVEPCCWQAAQGGRTSCSTTAALARSGSAGSCFSLPV
jgi:hypothetical protein